MMNEGVEHIEVENLDVTFDQIGGQDNAKREIEGVSFALSNPDAYKKWGTKPPKGVLLYGPPGTGKTLLAKALASSADARFLHVKASDMASMWYGESEILIQRIFDAANSGGKTIIFFDEIDSIVPSREGQHEATQRVVGTILQNIDGIGSNDNVIIVASTNRKQQIDPAMLRAGRLDKLVEVPPPTNDGRKQILNIHMAKADQLAERSMFMGVDTEELAKKTPGFTGADIEEIIRRTLEEKLRLEEKGENPDPEVSTRDILNEISKYERKVNSDILPGQYL